MNNYERMFFEKSNSQPALGNHPKDMPMVNFGSNDYNYEQLNAETMRMTNGSNKSKRPEASFREKQGSALKYDSELMPFANSAGKPPMPTSNVNPTVNFGGSGGRPPRIPGNSQTDW
jgi:hypothetical protein